MNEWMNEWMPVGVFGGWLVQELKELAALAYRDTTNENREFWKNEMGQALRDIQQVYDDKLDATRNDVETYYNLKVIERSLSSAYNQCSRIRKHDFLRFFEMTYQTNVKSR